MVTVAEDTLEHAFEPAPNPDRGFRPAAWLRNLLSGLRWTVRSVTGL